jgi:hypothetical protein
VTDAAVHACPLCELPIDEAENPGKNHEAVCIGQTPWVLHNRNAGMVVYLSADEFAAMTNARINGAEMPDGMADAIVARTLFGITEYEPPAPAGA